MIFVYFFFLIVSIFSQSLELDEPQNVTSSPCTDSNHLFLAPGVLSAGGTNRACVSRFHTDGNARMLLRLTTDDQQTATATRDLPPGDGGCIDIVVPQRPNTKAQLIVNLWYHEAQCSWERELTVRVSSGRVLVVHTERARYRPGDTLRARVLALKADLAPVHGVIEEIWLEGPRGAWSGARAAQWQAVRARMGIAQIQHELDELAPPGHWTVHARLGDGTQGSAGFMVGNYELPPFQLSVRHAQRVLRASDRLVWTVCVRYPWTEAVEGMLVIRIRGAGGTTVGNESSAGIRTVVRIRAPRACHRHAAASRRIGLNGTNPPDVVVADFSFQEDGTRIWQNTTVVSQVVDKPISLEFLTKNRAVISPRLPYKLKVKATRWDDKPAGGVLVRVCRDAVTSPLTSPPPVTSPPCSDAFTDAWGVARLTFTASDAPVVQYTFQASLANDSSTTAPPLQIAVRHAGSVHAALGPIRPDTESGKTFVPLYVNLRNATRPITVHFVVITRGGIIYRWGATTQCPLTSSADYLPTTSRNSQCLHAQVANLDTNLANFDGNLANFDETEAIFDGNLANFYVNFTNSDANMAKLESDSLVDRHLLRVMLPIKVTHQMCPDSHLIAFFQYNGELVSASKHFEMEECFNNKVELTWASRQVAPGSIATLQITTTGPALCALTVLDSAAKWNQLTTTVKDVLMTGLMRLMHSHRNLTEYDAAGACFLTSDSPELPTDSLELTATWLAAAGVRITGGWLTRTRTKCVEAPAPLIDDATVPRSDFSEAWLWRLAGVGANGSASVSGRAPDSISRFEASASCLSRTGYASAPPAVLQVFNEFFIHADGPRRLKRGDAAIVRYRLFNYLYESLSVQIQIVTDSHLQGPTDHVESACISARASIARRVEIQAKAEGDARLSIRAKAVADGNCGNSTGRPGVSDEVIISIAVELEGVPQEEHKSILLCGRGSPESSSSEVSWPFAPAPQAVAGSEALTLWVAGDLTGPLLADADALVTLPRGCGEQNMARLATNLLALTLLPPTSAAAAAAKEHVARGFTRQLQYVHGFGGFSAFGAADADPSTWLTAFTLRYLRRAHKVMNPGLRVPDALPRAERWLLTQQMENGCFRNTGQVFHRELRGGLNEEGEMASVALTAYVVASLLESSAPVSARVLHNALSCLRALPPGKTRSPTRVYAQALLGYAFMRIRSYEDEIRMTNEASLLFERREAVGGGLKEDEELRELMALLKVARRSGDHVWWETSSLSTSIEATGYALLALSLCPVQLRSACAADARAATRWLSARRTRSGGMLATQDTLVALEALAAWSSVQPPTPPNLTVTARTRNDIRTVVVKPGDKVPELMRMSASDQLDVAVEGTGCALVQATRSYHSSAPAPAAASAPALWVQVAVHTDGPFDCDANGTYCACAAVIEACASWAGSLPSMWLLELRLPGAAAADAARLYRQLRHQDTLLRRIELTPSGGRATFYLGDGGGARGGGHACYNVHAVAPRTKTKPAYARVIDYYTPTNNHTQMYTIPEDCPPRIAHEVDEFTASENLFNKAKSLTDSSEILISHEFSFEDIPDGIPLEDPIYDTFNIDEIAYLSKFNATKHNPIYQNVSLENSEQQPAEIHYQGNQQNVSINKALVDAVLSETDVNYEIKKSVDPNPNVKSPYEEKNKIVHINVDRTAYESTETPNTYRIPTNQNYDTISYKYDVNQNNDDINLDSDGTHFNNNDAIRPNSYTNANSGDSNNKNNHKNNYEVQLNDYSTVTNIYDATTAKQGSYLNGNQENTAINEYVNKYSVQSNNYESTINTNYDVTPNIDGAHESSYYNRNEDDTSNSNYENDYSSGQSNNYGSTINQNYDVAPNNGDMNEGGYVRPNKGGGSEGKDHMDLKVDNPNLSDFHVIDSATDLDVPTGMEGPVPSIVLPPPNFVLPPPANPKSAMSYQRRFQNSAQSVYYVPYDQNPS